MTSPARPQATATSAATKKSWSEDTSATKATRNKAIKPNISMGSMLVCPTDWALMAQATNAQMTVMSATGIGSCSAMHAATAALARARMARPELRMALAWGAPLERQVAAVKPKDPPWQFACPAFLESVWKPRGKMSRTITAMPQPIMHPMPTQDVTVRASSAEAIPKAGAPMTRPRFASTAPPNHTTMAPVPTRKPTASIIGDA